MTIAVVIYGLTGPPILLLVGAFVHREVRLYREVTRRPDRTFLPARGGVAWDWNFDETAELDGADIPSVEARTVGAGRGITRAPASPTLPQKRAGAVPAAPPTNHRGVNSNG